MITNEAVNEGGLLLLVCTKAWTNVVNQGYVLYVQVNDGKQVGTSKSSVNTFLLKWLNKQEC